MRYVLRTISSLAALASLAPYVEAKSQYDYVIVGGGTAGLVLANRLTESKFVDVLVLEAGGDGLGNTNISDVSLIGSGVGTQLDWQFPTEDLTHCNGRNLGKSPRGKVLGGSSAINGDVWGRGDYREYDDWEMLGNPGWNFNSLFAASKKSEKFYPPASSDNIEHNVAAHGNNGPLATSYLTASPSIHDTIISTVINAGGARSADLADGNVDGISHVTHARLPSNNTRATSATGYYFPYSHRNNLKVNLYATATKIIWASTSGRTGAVASGVQYVDKDGRMRTVTADNVILSAGTRGSPPILERSGVSNPSILSPLGINTVVNLPGVGENLHEQPLATMLWAFNTSLPFTESPLLLNMESLQTTVGAENLATAEALLNVQPPNLSDAQFASQKRLYAQKAPWVEGYIAVSTPPEGPSLLAWIPVNLHQHSRGSVHIKSSDGLSYPKIIWNLFQSPFDTYVMAAAAMRVQRFVATPPLSDWIAGPILPAAGVSSMDGLGDFARANAEIANHIVGTALMAPRADGGVVDSKLKVYGTKNVYVIDASVIPVNPGAHTQATVYALAERAATLLKE